MAVPGRIKKVATGIGVKPVVFLPGHADGAIETITRVA